MSYRQEAERVLDLWRAVERELDAVAAGSPEAELFQTRAAQLRDEYQRLTAIVAGEAGVESSITRSEAGS